MYRKVFVLLFFLNAFIAYSVGARILCIAPTPSYSHQIVFRPIWKELAKRGHTLIVLTTDPENLDNSTNIRQINLHEAYNYWNITDIIIKNHGNPLRLFMEIIEIMTVVSSFELEHPEVQNLLKNNDEHFDLVISEYLFPVMNAFSVRFNCPYVGILSFDAPLYAHAIMGNPTDPGLFPSFELPFIPPLNFSQRIISVLFHLFTHIYGKKVGIKEGNKVVRKYFNENFPSLSDINKNVSMLFINTNPIFHIVRPLGPTTIQFGGGIHLTDPLPLPKELSNYLNKAVEGVIYISFGSNIKSHHITNEFKQILLETFRTLPYQILWKFEENFANRSDNINIISWGPQQDILKHPNVKLFISQGGLQSIEESIFNHVPLIVIPFFADQMANAKTIEAKGLGIHLNRDTLDVKTLKKSILKITNNNKYKNQIKKFSKLLKDFPMSGLEKVIWWIEYVIRHKGTKHLKIINNLYFFQYYCIDVIFYLIIIILIFLFIIFKIFHLSIITTFRKSKKLLKIE